MIPTESTPIKNIILTDIFAKGKLTYAEMRIAMFVIRWSWGFDAGDRRQEWTKDFTISEIAKEIKMDRGWCSKIIRKMVCDRKLLKDGDKYQFNEHYENWKTIANYSTVRETHTVRNTHANCEENSHPLCEKLTPTVRKTHTSDILQTMIKKDLEAQNPLRKETIK